MTNAATPAVPPVRIERVTKRFRQGEATIEALKDISLTVGAASSWP